MWLHDFEMMAVRERVEVAQDLPLVGGRAAYGEREYVRTVLLHKRLLLVWAEHHAAWARCRLLLVFVEVIFALDFQPSHDFTQLLNAFLLFKDCQDAPTCVLELVCLEGVDVEEARDGLLEEELQICPLKGVLGETQEPAKVELGTLKVVKDKDKVVVLDDGWWEKYKGKLLIVGHIQ